MKKVVALFFCVAFSAPALAQNLRKFDESKFIEVNVGQNFNELELELLPLLVPLLLPLLPLSSLTASPLV